MQLVDENRYLALRIEGALVNSQWLISHPYRFLYPALTDVKNRIRYLDHQERHDLMVGSHAQANRRPGGEPITGGTRNDPLPPRQRRQE